MEGLNISFAEAAQKVTGKLNGWLETAIQMLPNFVVAVLVVVLAALLAKLVRWATKKLFSRAHVSESIATLMSTIFYVGVLSIGVFVALGILHLDKTVSSLLAGAGIIGLALGFAFQDTAANFMSGIMMAFRKPLSVGDIVESQDYMGTVKDINLRTTVIKTFQGQEVLIPNKDVFNSPIVNFTKTRERRIDLQIGVSYGDDLDKAEKLAVEAAEGVDGRESDKEVNLFYTEFGSSSINFVLQVWINYPDQPGFLKVRSDIIKAVKRAFDENDITIPFPIRTLDFGIKGGETLEEMVDLKAIMNGKSSANKAEA